MKTNKNTISEIMNLFVASYPGKFIVAKDDNGHPLTPRIWLLMLRDFDAGVVLHAAYHLATTHKTWPPDVATVRDQAARLAHGEKTAPTGSDSWERVLKRINPYDAEEESSVTLSELEKQAVAQLGGLYHLAHSSNQAADRARYIKAFDDLIAKQQLDRVTLPEVQALVDRNRPALPAPQEVPQLHGATDETNVTGTGFCNTDTDYECKHTVKECGCPQFRHIRYGAQRCAMLSAVSRC
jgi:hypothetical protein